MDNRQLLLRGLPKIDELLLDEQLVFFMESTPRSVVVDAAREIIDELRREILSGERSTPPAWCSTPTWAAPICAGLRWKALRLWPIPILIWNTT